MSLLQSSRRGTNGSIAALMLEASITMRGVAARGAIAACMPLAMPPEARALAAIFSITLLALRRAMTTEIGKCSCGGATGAVIADTANSMLDASTARWCSPGSS